MLAHQKIRKAFTEENFKYYEWNEKPIQAFLEDIDVYLAIIHPRCKEQGGRSNMEAMMINGVSFESIKNRAILPAAPVLSFMSQPPLSHRPTDQLVEQPHNGHRLLIPKSPQPNPRRSFRYELT